MTKERKNFRLDTVLLSNLEKQLGYDQTEVVEKALNAYDALRRAALKEIKESFTREELLGLIDMQNGHLLSPQLQARVEVYLGSLEDAQQYDQLSIRWDFNYEILRRKIEFLSPNAVYFLQEEIDRFWKEPKAFGSPTPDLEIFIRYIGPQAPPAPSYYATFRTEKGWIMATPFTGVSSEALATEVLREKGASLEESDYQIFTDLFAALATLPSQPVTRDDFLRIVEESRQKNAKAPL